MKKFYTLAAFLIFYHLTGFAQGPNEDWVTYIRQQEKGPMVITTNLFYNFVGKPNYKNLLIVGTNTRDCKKNGYPDDLGLSKFYMLSDSIENRLNR
ncbi:MAG: hypothetical protein QNJ57_09165, partial [Flavobacteriaceae bacterium]|nr:hypothetical protein [Flavobacteriaceae bacterium]